jgi:hypothetical protein
MEVLFITTEYLIGMVVKEYGAWEMVIWWEKTE